MTQKPIGSDVGMVVDLIKYYEKNDVHKPVTNFKKRLLRLVARSGNQDCRSKISPISTIEASARSVNLL